MRVAFFLVFVIAISIQARAQRFAYPKGVYMSMADIANREPSEQFDLKITERPLSDIKLHGGNNYLVEPNDKVKKKFIRKNIRAISDGNSLYINGAHFDCQPHFAKVEHIGKTLVYKGGVRDKDIKTNVVIFFGVLGGPIGAAVAWDLANGNLGKKRFVYKLNSSDGRTQKVEKAALEQLLEKYPDLLEKYKAETDPEDLETILTYTILANHLPKDDQ